MITWWPRLIPYIGTAWATCDRYGDLVEFDSAWQVRVFVAAWGNWAFVFFQWGLPTRIVCADEDD